MLRFNLRNKAKESGFCVAVRDVWVVVFPYCQIGELEVVTLAHIARKASTFVCCNGVIG